MHWKLVFVLLMVLNSCGTKEHSHRYSQLEIENIYEDSISIRAIDLMNNSLAFAGTDGIFGNVDLQSHRVRTNTQYYDTIVPQYRAVSHTNIDFFMLSIADPALLYKTGDKGKMELVYKEEGDDVFYDSMAFWNDLEGIAVGDSRQGCLSIIITRDGGTSWNKLNCDSLPGSLEGEGAFAASDTNIKIIGSRTWIATTSGRILYSGDKGITWKAIQTPIVNKEPTQGIYSIDFYNEHIGFAIGGDYTDPEVNTANKALTMDGGFTWQLIGDGMDPGYKSCIQFIPNSGGEDLVAIGFTGVSYSSDMGKSWKQLSDASFYTLRFSNDSVAYAAGKNIIAKLSFK